MGIGDNSSCGLEKSVWRKGTVLVSRKRPTSAEQWEESREGGVRHAEDFPVADNTKLSSSLQVNWNTILWDIFREELTYNQGRIILHKQGTHWFTAC